MLPPGASRPSQLHALAFRTSRPRASALERAQGARQFECPPVVGYWMGSIPVAGRPATKITLDRL